MNDQPASFFNTRMADTNQKGVEHASNFLDCIDKWTTHVLEDVSDDRIRQIFQDSVCVGVSEQKSLPVSDKQADRLAKKMKSAIIDSTPKHIRAEIAEGLDENGFNQKFQLLHDLREKYKGRTEEAWRPPYDASDHMRAARVKAKESQLQQLQLLISIKKRTIAGLKDKVHAASVASTKKTDLVRQIEEDFESIKRKSEALIENVDARNNHLLCAMANQQSINY